MGVRVFFGMPWIRFAESGEHVGCGSGAQVEAGRPCHVQVRTPQVLKHRCSSVAKTKVMVVSNWQWAIYNFFDMLM